MTKLLDDGVYVGLDAETYFEDDRLGSSDLKTLHNRPADWWYGSRHNPDRADKDPSAEMCFGTALHTLLLEGEAAYRKHVAIKPLTYEDEKTGEVKPWNGNANVCKRWLALHERPDLTIIDENADRCVRHMAALIENHPELGEPMKRGLPEVSVLFTHLGLRMRARFDNLLPRFIVDLKSYGGGAARGVGLTQECLWIVKDRHYDVQRYQYFLARQAMLQLISEGRVFGATPEQADWLRKVAAVEVWRWCWLFYRRRDDDKGHAPMVKPIFRSHFDATFDSGRQKFETAVQNYVAFRDRFGFEVPWAMIEPGEEPPDHAMPIGLSDCPPPVTFPAEEAA